MYDYSHYHFYLLHKEVFSVGKTEALPFMQGWSDEGSVANSRKDIPGYLKVESGEGGIWREEVSQQ